MKYFFKIFLRLLIVVLVFYVTLLALLSGEGWRKYWTIPWFLFFFFNEVFRHFYENKRLRLLEKETNFKENPKKSKWVKFRRRSLGW